MNAEIVARLQQSFDEPLLLPEATRVLLARKAAENGRSLDAEVQVRLRASFHPAHDLDALYRKVGRLETENAHLQEALSFTRRLLGNATQGQQRLSDALIRYLTESGADRPNSEPLLGLAEALKAAIQGLDVTGVAPSERTDYEELLPILTADDPEPRVVPDTPVAPPKRRLRLGRAKAPK